MSRVNYTYTAIYNRSSVKPARYPPAESYGRTYALEPHYQQEEDSRSEGRSDTPVLALLFFILPILGLFAILFKPMRYVFFGASLLAMVFMWGVRSFQPRARLVTSMVLLGLAAFSLSTAIITAKIPGAGGNNQSDYSPTPPANLGAVGGLGAGDDSSADVTAANANTPLPRMVKTDAEVVLEAYLDLWKQGASNNQMVQYTWPEWRLSVAEPAAQLFFKHQSLKLLDYTITPPIINDVDKSCTITVVTTQQLANGTEAKKEYYVLMHKSDDGTWYVDPNSLSAGVPVTDPTPTPDPNATPTPKPTSTAVKSSTVLYWNTQGGTKYHAVKECKAIAERYWKQMSSFTYNKLGDKTYSKLQPCSICNAPARP